MKTSSLPGLISFGALLVTSTLLCASETDDRIESSFSKSYAYKVYLKGDAIKAESRNGVVTLTGQVNEASHKALAQEAVAGLPGVQRVDNRLEIKLEGTEKSDTLDQVESPQCAGVASQRERQQHAGRHPRRRDHAARRRHERGAKGAGQ